jgi:hypothetical protein
MVYERRGNRESSVRLFHRDHMNSSAFVVRIFISGECKLTLY